MVKSFDYKEPWYGADGYLARDYLVPKVGDKVKVNHGEVTESSVLTNVGHFLCNRLTYPTAQLWNEFVRAIEALRTGPGPIVRRFAGTAPKVERD